ncbi:MAG: glycosyltransferase family 2 protein [Anaerolineales bacterium]|jgi:GT2 family glycosyltransferase
MGVESPAKKRSLVAFVVVNWNQCQLTLDCLASLREQTYRNFSVVLVDNGSQDGSVQAVQEQFPEVTVLENGRNLGIAGANNVGIKQALGMGADYVFLLNNDTIVDAHMLDHLVQVAESDSSIGMAGPTMLFFDQPDTIWCAGNSIDWTNGETLRLREGASLSTVKDASLEDVDFITSCAVLIKRAVFEQVGLMDERYFIYYDETDWFARAAASGWRSVYVPWAKMWHKVSASMGESSPRTDYYMVRNRFLFLSKNLTGFKKALALTWATLRNIRIITAYTLKNRSEKRLSNRNAKYLGLRDAIAGRWGEMGPDVSAMCNRS